LFADPQDSFDLNGDFFCNYFTDLFGNSKFLRTFTETNKQRTRKMKAIFAIQDSQNNFFIKNRNLGQLSIPHFGNDSTIQIFDSASDAQKVADTLQVPVTVQQIIKRH
jgi:hypothetical protein